MGGSGSGNFWSRYNKKTTVEECQILTVDHLIARSERRTGESRVVEMGLRTSAGVLEIQVPVIRFRRKHDRIDWLLACPLKRNGKACFRLCRKLYRPSGSRVFGCRQCHGLTYQSCNDSHRFDAVHQLVGSKLGMSADVVRQVLSKRGLKAAFAPRSRPKRKKWKPWRVFCDATTRAGATCKRKPTPGKTRCHLHGGKSCGPKTANGIANSRAALDASRKRGAEIAGMVHKASAHGRQLGREWVASKYFSADGAESLWCSYAKENSIPLDLRPRMRDHWFTALLSQYPKAKG